MVDMKAFSIRIPDQLHDLIIEIAAKEFRSVNQQIEYFLTKAAADYRERHEWPEVERLLSESERQEIASPAQPGRKGRGRPAKAPEQTAPSTPPPRQSAGVPSSKIAPQPQRQQARPPVQPKPKNSYFDEDDIPPF